MSERISRDDVVRVAGLARLRLDDDQIDRFTGQLAAVLEHARDVDALDLEDVPPMTHPSAVRNVWRDDAAGATLTPADALAGAPRAESGRFAVPTILGEAP